MLGKPQGADPHPSSSTREKAFRNNLNKEITPLLPSGIGERCSQTISNLGPGALCAGVNYPNERKCWTNSGGPLVHSVAVFIDLRQEDKVNSCIGLSYWPASHVAWSAGTTTLCRRWLYPPRWDLWIRLQYSEKVAQNLSAGKAPVSSLSITSSFRQWKSV